ncbi:MAG: hypothetical protein FWG13_02355, partial [Leptospirales bacterium]|nr:hypothetical protein [Leptospirales bacterium]
DIILKIKLTYAAYSLDGNNMATEDIKSLERMVSHLMASKEIPPSTMGIVRPLISNIGVSPEERYRTIIRMLENLPEKNDGTEKKQKEQKEQPKKPDNKDEPVDHFHTETSLYIDSLYRAFRRFKFFKIRYLARRNNHFNIGFKKRLIPSKKLLKALEDIYAMQDEILARLPAISKNILDDGEIDDPTCFNYLRIIRNWLTGRPLVSLDYSVIKWMERNNFERELKDYLYNAFAIRSLGSDKKDRILKQVKDKLSLMKDLSRAEVISEESDAAKKDKERANYGIDKKIYYYMTLLRSFLYDDSGHNPISEMLLEKYGVSGGYNELIMMIIQALIYQRRAKAEDFVYKFEVKAPEVSSINWNYSDEYLKKIGKDSSSRRQKVVERLKERLVVYDIINDMLETKDGDKDLVEKGVGLQWKIIDKNKAAPAEVFNNDFPVFLDSGVIFFNNLFAPILAGEQLVLNDREKKEIVSSIFAKDIFSDEIRYIGNILNDFNSFRNDNPMLVLSREEVVRILQGKIVSMDHVESIMRNTGNLFYKIAQKLFPYYYRHRQWITSENPKTKLSIIRTPIAADGEPQDPIPFYDCVIKGFGKPAPLAAGLEGKKIIGTAFGEGVIDFILAYSYQVANLCLNAELVRNMEERDGIIFELEKSAGSADGAD